VADQGEKPRLSRNTVLKAGAILGGATALLAVGCSSNLTQEESVQATAQALGAEGLKEELAKLNPVQKYLTVKLENERSLVGKSGNEEARGGGTGYFFYQEKLADGRTLSLMVSSGHGNNQWVEGFCISQPHLENGSARSVKDTAKEKFYVFPATGDAVIVAMVTQKPLTVIENDFVIPIKKDPLQEGIETTILGFPKMAPYGFVTSGKVGQTTIDKVAGPIFDVVGATGGNGISGAPVMVGNTLVGIVRGASDDGRGLKSVILGPMLERLIKARGEEGEVAKSVDDVLRREGINKTVWTELDLR